MTAAEGNGRRSQHLTLAAMCCGVFMVMLDATITANVQPVIQRQFSISVQTLQWVSNSYTLAVAALVVLGGKLGDIFGRKRFFLIGLAIFTIGSVLAGASPTATLLIASRGFQGIGAALLEPLTLSILDATFPPEERGRAIGIWAGISALSLSIGPFLGGVLAQHASWRWIFYINVPVCLAAMVLASRHVRESRDEESDRSVDRVGALLVTGALFMIVFATMQGRAWGWSSPGIVALYGSAAVGAIAFVAVEKSVEHPLIDIGLFRNSTVVGSNVTAFFSSFTMMGALFFLPLYFQDVLGYSPTKSGLAVLPVTLMITLSAPAAGLISDRQGPRWPMVAGMAMIGGSYVLMGSIGASSGYGDLWLGFVLLGAGIGFVMAPMSTAVMECVPENKAGESSGIVNMSRYLGSTFGVAVLVSVFASTATAKATSLVSSFPAGTRAAARGTIGTLVADPDKAAGAIASLPASLRGAAVHGFRTVFTHGEAGVFLWCAVVGFVGVVVAATSIRYKPAAAVSSAGAHHRIARAAHPAHHIRFPRKVVAPGTAPADT